MAGEGLGPGDLRPTGSRVRDGVERLCIWDIFGPRVAQLKEEAWPEVAGAGWQLTFGPSPFPRSQLFEITMGHSGSGGVLAALRMWKPLGGTQIAFSIVEP